jgi:hypothetical protein
MQSQSEDCANEDNYTLIKPKRKIYRFRWLHLCIVVCAAIIVSGIVFIIGIHALFTIERNTELLINNDISDQPLQLMIVFKNHFWAAAGIGFLGGWILSLSIYGVIFACHHLFGLQKRP